MRNILAKSHLKLHLAQRSFQLPITFNQVLYQRVDDLEKHYCTQEDKNHADQYTDYASFYERFTDLGKINLCHNTKI